MEARNDHDVADSTTVSKYNKASVCYQQPSRRSQLSLPTFETESPLIKPPTSRQHPRSSLDRRPSVASKFSQRTRPKSRRSTNKSSIRPTISGPTNFRRSDASFDFIIRDEARDEEPPRTISPFQKISPFRPIQLSIYLPGKELPALPKFSDDDDDDDDDIPEVQGIQRPSQALMKTKSEPMLTRQLTSFSIPRKPVGSRTNSMQSAPRSSIDSGLTLNNSNEAGASHHRSASIDRLISDHRPSLSASRSVQEFMEIINAPLPPLPKPTDTSHTETSPVQDHSIYRSASERSMRLRTHLEECRQSNLACDTISEERSPVSPSPHPNRTIPPSQPSTANPPPKPAPKSSSSNPFNSATPQSPNAPRPPTAPSPLEMLAIQQPGSTTTMRCPFLVELARLQAAIPSSTRDSPRPTTPKKAFLASQPPSPSLPPHPPSLAACRNGLPAPSPACRPRTQNLGSTRERPLLGGIYPTLLP